MTDTADVSALDALPADDPWRRIIAKMLDPEATYTNAQMAWLVEDAFRRGRETGYTEGWQARVAAENAAYPPAPLFIGGKWVNVPSHAERRAADMEGIKPRPGDWPGIENGGQPPSPWRPTWCGSYKTHRRHRDQDGEGAYYACRGVRNHAQS